MAVRNLNHLTGNDPHRRSITTQEARLAADELSEELGQITRRRRGRLDDERSVRQVRPYYPYTRQEMITCGSGSTSLLGGFPCSFCF